MPLVAKDDTTTPQLVAVIAPLVIASGMAVRAQDRRSDFSARAVPYPATPKRALLCTFLI